MPKLPYPDDESEDEQFDMRALMRLGMWGGAAGAALLVAAFATRTEVGQSRVAMAMGSATTTPVVAVRNDTRPAPRSPDADIEARRLADSVRILREDRDRLLARMTALERNYEDVTGSIGRIANATKPPAEPPALPVIAAPDVAPPATPVATPDRSASATTPAAEPEISARSEFGVDLGSAPTIASLRVSWNQIRRNHSAMLEGLRPVVAVRDGKAGNVELRLIAGPIANASAAAKLCAALAAGGLSCQPAMFDGQRLALR